jgi:hypothetical protein
MAELSETEKYAEVLNSGGSYMAKLVGNGQRPIRISTLPEDRFGGAPIGIWNLMQYETQQARLDAIKWIQEICKIPDSALLADSSLAVEETHNQILFRCLRNPNDPAKPAFGNVGEIRTLLTPDERESLHDQYLDFVQERSPLKKLRSIAEVDELVAAMGKGSLGRQWIASYDIVSLRSITLSLAERCETLIRENFSLSGSANVSNQS